MSSPSGTKRVKYEYIYSQRNDSGLYDWLKSSDTPVSTEWVNAGHAVIGIALIGAEYTAVSIRIMESEGVFRFIHLMIDAGN